jgi:hypothetical protein
MGRGTKVAAPVSGRARTPRASGRFLLRLEPGLHKLLRATAADAGQSLNDLCARKLAATGHALEYACVPAAILQRAATQLGGALVGLALYGSFARGTAAPDSDVDLLLVVESGVPLTRELYRRWGEERLRWGGREVEVHFAHLPSPSTSFGGFWAEVALDGIVLFERGLRLSRALIAVRREILAGRVERRAVHGQAYWTDAAPGSGVFVETEMA